ncbi:hypothetical protein ABC347_13845 [Sphingomonas sp. 1P06PA]|uniref:phenylacetate--CoA ligase family protein n=1 Tax=Sphingomonas sp. 1P06PA TaxID=554121 RepID=UPI0039A6DF52
MTDLRSQVAARMRTLERSEAMSLAQIHAGQFALLRALVAHHAAHSPHFARRLAGVGLSPADLGTPDGLAKLPPLSRRQIQTATDLFSTPPAGHGATSPRSTSGSTGEPVRILRTALNQVDWLAVTMRDHRWNRRDFAGRFAAFRARVEAPRRMRDWGLPAALFHRTGPAIAVRNTLPIDTQLDLLRDFAPTTMLAYPAGLAGLIDRLEALGERIGGIADVRTVGAVVSPDLRARCLRWLGAPIADTYSSEEMGYVALQCPESGLYHVMAETMLVEVVDDDGGPTPPGRTGRLLLTDLRNYATPMIRYEIGDHAEPGPPCPCGRGLPTLVRIAGRERNLMSYPDGSRGWPYLGRIRHRDVGGVIQYRYEQVAADRMAVTLVVEAPLDDAAEDRLRAEIVRGLGFPFAIDFSYSDRRLEPGPNGKFEEFINRTLT